ncbi:MAG: hypothetical protein EZS28_010153 [Streblomastix strix]|uniref:Uncharacterized protein n=1 Tax=Streblomastix strix TaxID=222440 RepID=A0A5J4WH72_9EUKA|nr:MAG: hypothetical protein EZS28_010153 [Streblomastix strix]
MMASLNKSNQYYEKDSRTVELNSNPDQDTSYSRIQQFSGGCTIQNGLGRGPLGQEGDNEVKLSTTKLLSESGRLHDMNFKIMQKVLLSIKRQKSRSQ